MAKIAFQVRLEDDLVLSLEQAGSERFGGTKLSRNRLIEIAVRELVERQRHGLKLARAEDTSSEQR